MLGNRAVEGEICMKVEHYTCVFITSCEGKNDSRGRCVLAICQFSVLLNSQQPKQIDR
jgi:hypothetical protein